MSGNAEHHPLQSRFRGLICDLDGVVYRGPLAVPHAVPSLERSRQQGCWIVFATNSAVRTPQEVSTQLRRLGLDVTANEVVTSAQAGAAYLAQHLPPGSTVLALGGPGVSWAVEQAGLTAMRAAQLSPGEPVAAVLQGLGRELSWTDLAEAAVAIRAGAQWVATNLDITVPTDRGPCPGNGSMVAALRPSVGIDPVALGKPEAYLYQVCATKLKLEPSEILAVGDRLDTDVVGANRAGMASLHVLTGVEDVVGLCAAQGPRRPMFQSVDLRALHESYDQPVCLRPPEPTQTVWQCASVQAQVDNTGVLRLQGRGTANQRLRAVVAAAWAAVDHGWPAPTDESLRTALAWSPGAPDEDRLGPGEHSGRDVQGMTGGE